MGNATPPPPGDPESGNPIPNMDSKAEKFVPLWLGIYSGNCYSKSTLNHISFPHVAGVSYKKKVVVRKIPMYLRGYHNSPIYNRN